MIDLFSAPFQLYQGFTNTKRQTIGGQFISFAIFVTCILYFIHLIQKFNNNDLVPNIAKTPGKETQYNEYQFKQNSISYQILFNGQMSFDHEFFEKYFTIQHTIQKTQQNQKQYVEIEKANCQQMDSQKSSLLYPEQICLNSFSLMNEKSIINNRFYENESYFLLQIIQCNSLMKGVNCHSNEEIKAFLEQNSIEVIIQISLEEFNYKNKELENKTTTIKLNVNHLSQSHHYWVEKNNYEIDDSLILYKNQKQTAMNIKQHQILNQIGTEPFNLSQLIIKLTSEEQKINVQYIKLPELISYTVSVYFSLCIFGLFLKVFSQALLVQDIIDYHLKFYYQKVRSQMNQALNLSSQSKSKQQSIGRFKVNKVHGIWYYIKYTYLKFCCKRKRKEEYQHQCSSTSIQVKKFYSEKIEDIYFELFDTAKHNIQLQTLFKELMQLKTCVQFLLTEEQYAAIKFTGRSLPPQELLQKPEQNNNNSNLPQENFYQKEYILNTYQYKGLNHLEKMDLIDKNKKLQQVLFKKFRKSQLKPLNQNTFTDSMVMTPLNKENNINTNSKINSLILEALVKNTVKQEKSIIKKFNTIQSPKKMHSVQFDLSDIEVSQKLSNQVIPRNQLQSRVDQVQDQIHQSQILQQKQQQQYQQQQQQIFQYQQQQSQSQQQLNNLQFTQYVDQMSQNSVGNITSGRKEKLKHLYQETIYPDLLSPVSVTDDVHSHLDSERGQIRPFFQKPIPQNKTTRKNT